ncbi:MAG: hydroxyacylglutathione hydrolase family protein [bacterium]|nr:hydroxyacylglutathione hydrolase family protein [bacterium]
MVRQIPINGYDNNFSYFIGDDVGKNIAIVDPGDVPHLITEIEYDLLGPQMILVTHTHHDHIEGVPGIVDKYAIPVYMHENGRGRVDANDEMCVFVKDGDEIKIGDLNVKVLYTPGHIDDAVCYYITAAEAADGIPKLITGDTLFVEGCGRADLEGSNVEDLYNSLQKISALPDDTKIFPGHDYGSKPVSTIAWEKKHNKYLKCKNLDEFIKLRLG